MMAPIKSNPDNDQVSIKSENDHVERTRAKRVDSLNNNFKGRIVLGIGERRLSNESLSSSS